MPSATATSETCRFCLGYKFSTALQHHCKTQNLFWNPFAEFRRGWMSFKLCPSMLSEKKTTKIAWQFIYCDRDGLVWDGCGPSEMIYMRVSEVWWWWWDEMIMMVLSGDECEWGVLSDEEWWVMRSDEEWDVWWGMSYEVWEQVLKPGIEHRS